MEGGNPPSGGVSCDCEAPSCGTAEKDAETSQKGPFMGAPLTEVCPEAAEKVLGKATTGGEASACASLSLQAVASLTAAGTPGPRGGARPCVRHFYLYSHYPTYRSVLV